jgi:hypothetical protein
VFLKLKIAKNFRKMGQKKVEYVKSHSKIYKNSQDSYFSTVKNPTSASKGFNTLKSHNFVIFKKIKISL